MSLLRLLCACCFALSLAPAFGADSLPPPDPALQALQWRLVGPYRGGRSVAVTGVPGDGHTFYFGGADGGVWKSTDAGHSWNNVSDCCLDTGAIGALTVAASDHATVYAGTGEGFPRGDMVTGDGLWKSRDAGKTWSHAGLEATHVITRIVVDPQDAQHLYVAALGHVFGSNPERGIYESRDGGTHWARILFTDAGTGAADLVMDPHDSKVLYAALWQVTRSPWDLENGGPGSAIYKTTDGGAHWTDLSRNPGLPARPFGRIGLALSGAAPGRIYALVEAGATGLYRSDDAGAHWRELYHKGDLDQRAWYFGRIYADPKDADRLYAPQPDGLMTSNDGGATFKSLQAQGGDNHVLWIDPEDPATMILANDGGATVTLDGGKSWSSQDNQPTGQFYHVNVDDQFPFHLYGPQQDRSTLEIASADNGAGGGIDVHDWQEVAQWESGYSVPVPGKPWITYSSGGYAGMLERTDRRLEQRDFLGAWPEDSTGTAAAGLKYRFQWTFPLLIPPEAPDTLYIGSQYVMQSDDAGRSWREISPDLTRDDKSKQQPSGGPLHKDITSVEYYDTVFALADSRLDRQLLWAGTDDGRVWVTRDAGGRWREVTPPDLPAWSTVNIIEASRFAPGSAYLAVQDYRRDDFAPYLYATADYGAHWRKIVAGLPADGSSLVIREDSRDPELLFAGTLTGVYYSVDAGGHWQPLQLNLPHVAIHDLAVVPQQDALAVATHGRAFWVLDNIQPLRELTPQALAAPLHLFTPQTAWLTASQQDPDAGKYDAGVNPANGASIFYELKQAPAQGTVLALSITDAQGKAIASFTTTVKAKTADQDARPDADADTGNAPPAIGADAGMNLFVWDLCAATLGEGEQAVPGPQVPPGRYRVSLSVGKDRENREFEVQKDPRAAASEADLQARYAFLLKLQAKMAETGAAADRIAALRHELGKRPADAARLATLERIAAVLVTPDYVGDRESLAHPASLQDRLGSLVFAGEGHWGRPTPAVEALFASLASQVDAELLALKAFDDVKLSDKGAFHAPHPPHYTAFGREQDRD
ncbi:MAG TPA: glycosyl hydrolase [Gammaproteobacteria bacterium]|nr:glycosyl hydrolase [Gammaproteobacteria bacterium]